MREGAHRLRGSRLVHGHFLRKSAGQQYRIASVGSAGPHAVSIALRSKTPEQSQSTFVPWQFVADPSREQPGSHPASDPLPSGDVSPSGDDPPSSDIPPSAAAPSPDPASPPASALPASEPVVASGPACTSCPPASAAGAPAIVGADPEAPPLLAPPGVEPLPARPGKPASADDAASYDETPFADEPEPARGSAAMPPAGGNGCGLRSHAQTVAARNSTAPRDARRCTARNRRSRFPVWGLGGASSCPPS